jgi:hypothetical protein
VSDVQVTSALGFERTRALRFQGVLWPALAVGMAAPITYGAIGGSLDGTALLLISPAVLAFLAAPGYLVALLSFRPLRDLPGVRRWWIRLSFVAALAACLVGGVIGLAFILPSIAAALSAMVVLRIWVRLDGSPEPAQRSS